jgi:hypothetical protein
MAAIEGEIRSKTQSPAALRLRKIAATRLDDLLRAWYRFLRLFQIRITVPNGGTARKKK